MYKALVYKDIQADFKSYKNWTLSHKHSTYEIFMLYEGEKEIIIGKRHYLMKPGYVCLLYPDVAHKYIGDAPYSRYQITFTEKFLDTFFTEDFKKRLIRCFEHEVISLTPNETETFQELFDRLIRHKKSGFDYPVQLADMMDMLNVVSERRQNSKIIARVEKKEIDAVKNVEAYINANYRSIRSMDEIVRACYISKGYLCHVFKKTYGMTVMGYLRKLRIRYACEFLATTDKKLSLIAVKMGFVDLSHFSRVFKNEMGMSPSEYREQKRQERDRNDV